MRFNAPSWLAGRLWCFALVFASTAILTAADYNQNVTVSKTADDYPVGDPRSCVEAAKRSGFVLERFEVLPGFGWDNLRNVDQGQVISFNYSQCRTTPDGRFLLPDSVNAVPVKTSRVETFAELIEHYKSWTSMDSQSINVDAGMLVEDATISGQFSDTFENIKTKQIEDRSVTTRTQARYVRYAVQQQPDAALHPSFVSRLLDIAAMHQINETEQARYLAQLLVRDFGTHVVTRAQAGAALVKVDHIRDDWRKTVSEQKNDVLVAASVSMMALFNISISYDQKHDQTFTDKYVSAQTSSYAQALGGPIFLPGSFVANAWTKQVDSNLVALDRSGDPLHFVVTASALPMLQESTANQLAESVREAVSAYYAHNKIPGCMDRSSPNFLPPANVDDGSCEPPTTNLTFGGVFQNCTLEPGSNNGDLCKNLNQVNPATKTFSCLPNYRPVHLNHGMTRTSRVVHSCSWFLFIKICHDTYYASTASYDMYWCVATGHVSSDSGYMFGGLYTSRVDNIVTKGQSCPPSFFTLRLGAGGDLRVCVGDDFEMGALYAVKFAGFLSCEAGNPLAAAGGPAKQNQYSKKSEFGEEGSLQSFFLDQAQAWPKTCPQGYSKHLAFIDQGCEVNYCAKTWNGSATPPIRRPPFMLAPSLPSPNDQNLVMFDTDTHLWLKNADAQNAYLKNMTSFINATSPTTSTTFLSNAAVAGISVAATLAAVGMLMAVWRCSQRRRAAYHRLPVVQYGSGDNTTTESVRSINGERDPLTSR